MRTDAQRSARSSGGTSGATRRALLQAGALGLVALLEPPGRAPAGIRALLVPRVPLRKCVSMGGYGPLTVPDGHPNDYRLYGNREYLRDLSGTRWVKLWVSWAHLQEELQPASRAESWAHLVSAPGGERALDRLDRQVRAAADDGLGVIVCLYQEFPLWSSGATPEDPARGSKPPNAKLPLDLSASGPWAWWVGHLCARYRRGAPVNPVGPLDPAITAPVSGYDVGVGNPLGAAIDAIEIVNEPNYLLWPQAGIHERVAEMIVTATQVSAALRGPAVVGPATSDFPDHPHETVGATDWLTFSERVLDVLGSPGSLALPTWTHHNYLDVKEETSGPDSRARRVADLLGQRGFLGAGPERRLWLTEGGYDLFPQQADPTARLAQARKLEHNFYAMAAEPDVHMWTQHAVNDVTSNDFKSGLRDEFLFGLGPGTPRPAWHVWAGLPGSAER